MSPTSSDFLIPIKVTGTDAAAFLHGQFTTDVTGLNAGQTALSAWCDPKGRVLFTFMLTRLDDAFLLLLPAPMQESFSKRLGMYVLRADVTITTAHTAALPPLPYLDKTGADTPAAAFIKQGIPLLYPETSGRFLPQELNLDNLNAVSFTKGCYPGQEIIARLRYRGEAKRRMCQARTDNNTPLRPGAALQSTSDNRQVGAIINSAITDQGQDLLLILEHPYIESKQILAENHPDWPVLLVTETDENL